MTRTAPNQRIVTGQPIEIRPGRVLNIAVQDAPGDLTIFLCHGSGGNKNQWRNQWLTLVEAGYRIVAWDFPGHGESPKPKDAGAYAGAAFVDDYLAILNRYGSRQNVIVAHSYGTRLTLAMLLKADVDLQARIRSTVLLGAVPPVNFVPKGPIVRWPLWLLTLIRPWLARGFAKLAWDKSADPELVAYEQDATRSNALFMMQSLMRQIVPLDIANIGVIATPAHIIAGASDGLTPPVAGEALAKALPQATFAVLEATGHQIMLERPDETTAAILSALA